MTDTRPVAGRNDIEWVMSENGPFLRHKPAWSAALTRTIARNREEERQRWLRNYRERQPDAPAD